MKEFNQTNSELIHRRLSKIGNAYNADFDIIQDQPNVNWVDVELMGCINLLLKRVEDLEWELLSLKQKVESPETDRPDYEY